MAFRHGRFAEITVNDADLSKFCDSADIGIDTDTSDTSAFGSAWKTQVLGQSGGQFSIKGNYDPTATTGPMAVLSALIGADAFEIVFYPGGNVAGQISYTADCFMTSYKNTSAVGSKVTFEAGFVADGEITPGIVGS
jgi:hypothetical protein